MWLLIVTIIPGWWSPGVKPWEDSVRELRYVLYLHCSETVLAVMKWIYLHSRRCNIPWLATWEGNQFQWLLWYAILSVGPVRDGDKNISKDCTAVSYKIIMGTTGYVSACQCNSFTRWVFHVLKVTPPDPWAVSRSQWLSYLVSLQCHHTGCYQHQTHRKSTKMY